MILATTPAPTVRPPSRIAKRRPSSIAIGWIKVTVTLNVVTWHYHFNAFWQFDCTSYVSCTEVELWTVAFEERSMTSTFFFGQNVHFCFELGVRLDRAWLSQYLTTFNVFTLGTTQQNTTFSPARPSSSSLRNISTPVQVVLAVSLIPTISTSSPTLTIPRSTRPVTTVPRPEIENTSSIGIRNGLSIARSGSGNVGVQSFNQLHDRMVPISLSSSPSSAFKAEPRMIGVSSPGKS